MKSFDEQRKENIFFDFPEDAFLSMVLYLTIRDAIRAFSINKYNQKFLTHKFWQKRLHYDFLKFPILPEQSRDDYIELYNKSISKIRDISITTLGFDKRGALYILRDSSNGHDSYISTFEKLLIPFAKKHTILDVKCSCSGTNYILTVEGLFGFGNNALCQLGINTFGLDVKEIMSVYQPKARDKIIDFVVGIYYVAVQTESELWLAGQINTAATMDTAGKYNPTSMVFTKNIVKIASGVNKLAIQFSDNSFVALDCYYFHQEKHGRLCNIPHWALNEFCDSKIVDFVISWGTMLVWCEDGLYMHRGERHDKQNTFHKLEEFVGKTIIQICASNDYISIYCTEGLFVSRSSGLLDKTSFIQFDLSATQGMPVKIDICPFIEIGGKWFKTKKALNPSEEKIKTLEFESVEVIPLQTPVEQEVQSDCRIF